MKKKLNNLLSFMLIVVTITMFFTSTAFAQNNANETDKYEKTNTDIEKQTNTTDKEKVFEKIIDKLNAEYGTNVRLCTDDELKQVGLDKETVQRKRDALSPAQFEATLRKEIEQNQKESEEARAKGKTAGITEKDMRPVTPIDEDKLSAQSSGGLYEVYAQKRVKSGIATLDAVIDTELSYPYWTSVYQATFLSGALYSDPPFFTAQTWGYQKLDYERTVAVLFNGYETDEYGRFTGNSTRYVEYYASDYV